MKKVLAFAFVAGMISFAACGGNKPAEVTEEAVVTEEVAPAVEEAPVVDSTVVAQ